jgi:hypothetical protein
VETNSDPQKTSPETLPNRLASSEARRFFRFDISDA